LIRILDIITPETFISYQWGIFDKAIQTHATQAFVKRVKDFIEETAEIVVWMDIAGGMGAGQNLQAEMQDGIRKSTVVVLMLSDSYVNSNNCKREFLLACRHSKFLVPVLLPDLGAVRGVSSGWSGPATVEDSSWWEHIKTVCEDRTDPDSGDAIDWSVLARFEPIDMRSCRDPGHGSFTEHEIVRKICSRFHRQHFVQHSPAVKYSKWKKHQEALRLFQALKGVNIETEAGIQQVKDFFREMDLDGNGLISKNELHAQFQRFRISVKEQEADELVRDADSNSDGQVDFQEFYNLVKDFVDSNTL